MGDNILINGEVLRQKWTHFADLAGVPHDERLKLSEGWLNRFKTRNSLKQFKRHGEAASASLEMVKQERERIQAFIKEQGFRAKDIFNMDETGLFYAMPPDKGLADKMFSGVKGKKNRLTYAFAANADGSEKREPFIIGRAFKPKHFKNQTGDDLGFYYRNNAKAWMTALLYQEWLQKWDRELQRKNRRILLLQDNFSGHIIPDGIRNIHVENFRPNLTAHIQPMDQGIIRCFKAHYRARFIQRAIENYDKGDSPAMIYDIDQLSAMRLAGAAWNQVDTTTIRNCWRKAGILPVFDSPPRAQPIIPISSLLDASDAEDLISGAEKDVEEGLEALAERGMLRKSNTVSIESLLNPADESQAVDESETTDKEICQAVLEARQQADGNSAGNDVDDSTQVEPRPTYQDVLHAASVINRFTQDLNHPTARKMEAALGSFTLQTRRDHARTMTATKITDFFRPKYS
ncbi:hypothetical protein M378DRAFT_187797 [Amanita muscaria Koide BX008]|uniref:HTH CENPB-type domain-containing protein n=1 Tax=Amanita muscaria (strain Koide BX008) TaxID=946122 RepID=A0A0C2WVJ2_AMAMK|nr:hypothetical protein M378DRAFT_187797 [Amanita muscaria Koide BX008]